MIRSTQFICILLITLLTKQTQAQYQSNVHKGEYGIALGLAHYMGDLNPNFSVDRPKIAIGAFYQKQFNNYVGLRLSANYASVGYADKYSNNAAQKRRNLSFNSDIWELTLQGQFNFFKFEPGNKYYNNWTPYITGGVGMFTFDPFAFLQDKKFFLQPLGTEGQNSLLFPDRNPYNLFAVCFPVGAGVKFNINDKMNIGLEATYRFTTTDYLDDVSATYAGTAAFRGATALALQDRSTELGPAIGVAGFQRGNSTQNDGYLFLQCMVSFNIMSYKCPTAK